MKPIRFSSARCRRPSTSAAMTRSSWPLAVEHGRTPSAGQEEGRALCCRAISLRRSSVARSTNVRAMAPLARSAGGGRSAGSSTGVAPAGDRARTQVSAPARRRSGSDAPSTHSALYGRGQVGQLDRTGRRRGRRRPEPSPRAASEGPHRRRSGGAGLGRAGDRPRDMRTSRGRTNGSFSRSNRGRACVDRDRHGSRLVFRLGNVRQVDQRKRVVGVGTDDLVRLGRPPLAKLVRHAS